MWPSPGPPGGQRNDLRSLFGLVAGRLGRAAKLCPPAAAGPRIERNPMTNDAGIERTLVLLKPDAVARGLVGRVLARFEDALLKIVAAKLVWMDADLARRHYFDLEERFGPAVFNAMATFMETGPVMALVLEGVEAVACTRKIVGSTYPDQAAPGTIRGDFAHMSRAYANARGVAVANLVHASGTVDEAAREIDVWFAKDEIFEYQTAADRFIR
jgi:nucleoside-diphosphate kinase